MADLTRSRSAERLIDILIELQTHGAVNRFHLMEKFNITERTAYRDLNMLSSFIECCGAGEYRLTHPKTPLLHNPLAKLLDADTFFPDRNELFWKRLEKRASDEHIRVLHLPAEHSAKNDLQKYLHLIEDAIQKNCVCDIFYKNTTRVVHPYKLVNQKSIWYLMATERGKLKSFSLSKINWLAKKNEHFMVNNSILSLINEYQDPWVSEETFEVQFRISHSISDYFTRRDLLPKQELLFKDENGETWRCRAAHKSQIMPLILFWLPNIEILKPEWLKMDFLNMLRSYLAVKNDYICELQLDK